jgi:hypothetical protein
MITVATGSIDAFGLGPTGETGASDEEAAAA